MQKKEQCWNNKNYRVRRNSRGTRIRKYRRTRRGIELEEVVHNHELKNAENSKGAKITIPRMRLRKCRRGRLS